MSETQKFDLVVIGAGPAGYVGAIRAAQLGMKVACVEKGEIGGTCLNVGCIPSKALLESSEYLVHTRKNLAAHGIAVKGISVDWKTMMARKDGIVRQLTGGVGLLFKKNGVAHIRGKARLAGAQKVAVSDQKGDVCLEAPHILIASGSVPATLPSLPIDGKRIVDSTQALSLDRIPERLIVVGGGYIGLELGSVYARLESKVVVLEAMDRLLPMLDGDVAAALGRALEKQGMEFRLGTKVEKASVSAKGVELAVINAKGETDTVKGDVVLVSVGRRPATQDLGLDTVGIALDERGRIPVDAQYRAAPGVYAVGDAIAGPMLAHKASEEAVALVEILAGQKGHVNYRAIPSVVYTHPEVASVGLTEEEVKEQGIAYKTAKFPFLANGRALALGESDGFAKLISDEETDRLLGAHIVGPRASELIAEMVLAIEFSASAEDVARTVHAHPTLSEAVKEAALGLGTGFIHLPPR